MSTVSGRKRRKTRKPSGPKGSGKSVMPWLALLLMTGGGIADYDNRAIFFPPAKKDVSGTGSPEGSEERTRISAKAAAGSKALDGAVAPLTVRPSDFGSKPETEALVGRGFTATFHYCGTSGLTNCVIDGNTFWHKGIKVRLANINAPDIDQAGCEAERQRAFAAKVRLRDLLNAGKFDLIEWHQQDSDQAGRKLRVVMRNGQSLGELMVKEGLVRHANGQQQPWC